jgi:hypothetical protein
MNLTLRRKWFTDSSTVGELRVDGAFECYTLEDVVRPGDILVVKVAGQTAIPAGRYRVIVDHSDHFKQDLPHVLDVPGFTGIRIHPGNTPADTDGCILVGLRRAADSVQDSGKAFDAVFGKVRQGIDAGGCFIEISGERDTSVTA